MVKGVRHLAGREVPEEKNESVATEEQPLPEQKTLSDGEFEKGYPQGGAPPQDKVIEVRNGAMLMNFLKPEFDKSADDEKLVGFEISLALTDEHRGLIPKKVQEAWDFLLSSQNKNVGIQGIDPQTIDFHNDPGEPAQLHVTAASIHPATITCVEQTGDGKTKTIYRFKFVAWTDLTLDNQRFACWEWDKRYWVKMSPTQGEIFSSKQ